MLPSLHFVDVAPAFSQVAAAAAGSLIASVWEGLLLVGCVALCLRMIPRLSAAARSLVWVAVLSVVVLLPLLSLQSASGHQTTAHQAGLLQLGERWSLAFAGVWVAMSVMRLAQLAISAVRLHTLARRATRVEASELIAPLLIASGRRAELCTSEEVDRPSVVGFFHPRILLPPYLLEKMSAAELEQVVLHEMEHLRRRDDWTNLLQKLALALLPLNPVLMWLDRRLCTERELACDDGVLRETKARKAYAACLARLAEASIVRRGVLLALGIFGKGRSELERRVYRILGRPEVSLSGTQTRMATGVLLAGVVCGAAALAGSPKLVSFGTSESPAAVAQAASVVGPQAPREVAGTAHATLAKAVVSTPAAKARLAVAVSQPRVRKPMVIKATHQSRASLVPHTVMTGWHEDVSRERTMRARYVSAQMQMVAGPRVVFAVDENSQLTYAAVPMRDGWLIVQL